MKLLLGLLLLSSSAFSSPTFWNTPFEGRSEAPVEGAAFDESYNFQPGLNLYNDAAQLTDLFGTKGSQLCAPNAITHALYYLKYTRQPNFPMLMIIPDMDKDGVQDSFKDRIRYFFHTCETDREVGTRYSIASDCMRKFVADSGYGSFSFMVGPHARYAPEGSTMEQMRSPIIVDHIRYYISNQAAVIMAIGWYKFNPATNAYERDGGHFFNVYGYDYNKAWGQSQVTLKVVNSWVNYTGRQAQDMYDNISMTKVNETFPEGHSYELSGNGFTFYGMRAMVEDLFIMYPVSR